MPLQKLSMICKNYLKSIFKRRNFNPFDVSLPEHLLELDEDGTWCWSCLCIYYLTSLIGISCLHQKGPFIKWIIALDTLANDVLINDFMFFGWISCCRKYVSAPLSLLNTKSNFFFFWSSKWTEIKYMGYEFEHNFSDSFRRILNVFISQVNRSMSRS